MELPHSLESEQGLLGCLLLDDAACWPEIDRAGVSPRWFHDGRHAEFFSIAREIREKGRRADVQAIWDRLKELERPHENCTYLAALPDAAPAAANLAYHLEPLREAWMRRTIIAHAEQAAAAARNGQSLEEVLARAEGLANIAKVEAHDIPEPLSWAELCKPVSFENNLLGDRFLERGQGFVIYGPAGCGKSVSALQAQAWWAAGLPGLHIPPVRPLRIVVLQTEDSLDDTRETLAGILSDSVFSAEVRALVERNLVILPAVAGGSPSKLAVQLKRAAEVHDADLVSVNPLLAFCPGDPAKELGGILYQYIDPAIKAVRVGFVGVHHTPKTNKCDTTGYGTHDWQYLAAGDARVANWPRAMLAIEESSFPVYRFRIAKRFGKSGWAQPVRYMAHAQPVRWIDADEEQATTAQPNAKTKEDLLRHVPPAGAIPQSVLLEKAQAAKIGKNRARAFLDELLAEGTLHVWLTKRKGTNPLKSISRHPQPEDRLV